jgi:hypothetical protein
MLLCSSFITAQKATYKIDEIPVGLTDNANAVIRYQKLEIDISSRRNVSIRTYRVISVLNEYGVQNVDAVEFRHVKSIRADVYDANGKKIKSFSRKDFKEVPYSPGSVITDNIATLLEYTPTQYPYTIIYESETGDSNTAFLPSWMPINQPFVSVENATIVINAPSELGLQTTESNFGTFNIVKNTVPNGVSYTATNIPALKSEQNAPALHEYMPVVQSAIQKFHLEGVDGEAGSWSTISSWMYNNLLAGTEELSAETKDKMVALVGAEQDLVQKAKIIYQYVQNKTRYVSIQVGIGGWRPMKAKDVDRLGYGDCKALTNYMRALLDAVGVPSYYAVIYAGSQKKDLDPNFVSVQGNHVILALPNGKETLWLECTSQTSPFGFVGDFTDDRLALPIIPSGGELVRTSTYDARQNSQFLVGNYSIDSAGNISGSVDIKSRGVQYDNKASLESKSATDLNLHYKSYFDFNNLQLTSTKLNNDKKVPEITESLTISAAGYAKTMSNRLMFAVNAFNQYSAVPVRYKNRIAPVQIQRGFYDNDEVVINLPEGYNVEALPTNVVFEDKFGQYNAEFKIVAPGKMSYKRSLLIREGLYAATEYENYRKFVEQIARAENSKIVLVKL